MATAGTFGLMDQGIPSGCDLCVVGAGIVGLAVAREMQRRHPGAEIVVLEREARIAAHQSGHSSGVIHAGIYYAPGTLKGRLSVEGARRLYAYCDERGIPAERAGKVIVATAEDELPRLGELERRGVANGVPGLRRIGPDELREIEPHAAGVAALHSPETGIVDFGAIASSLAAESSRAAGGSSPAARSPGSSPGAGGSGSPQRRARSTPAAPFSARVSGRIGSRFWPAPIPTRGSSPFAAPICACEPRGRGWCGRASIRCPIRISPSWGCT